MQHDKLWWEELKEHNRLCIKYDADTVKFNSEAAQRLVEFDKVYKAFKKGAQVQFRLIDWVTGKEQPWRVVAGMEPKFFTCFDFRIKPEDEVPLLQWGQETLKEMAEKNSAPLEINKIQDLHVPGAKDDASKPPVALVFESFPRALLEVAKVAGYGCQKYTRGGWKTVPDAITRYSDAGARHELYRHIEGETDPESGLLHLAHQAWNVLATLEKTLEEA